MIFYIMKINVQGFNNLIKMKWMVVYYFYYSIVLTVILIFSVARGVLVLAVRVGGYV
jgi:hypothetical protein